MDNKDYKETLAKQEDLNWDGNTEQEQIEYTYIVDEDSIEKLKKLLHD
jgi:hypothetical protein|tara:strand:- start:456 stop:599 length:144 start_codon:yes stop_codon:yes gene_type:complete